MTLPPRCLQGVLWGQKKEGGQKDRGVFPSLSGMMPASLSLSGCREGMVSFPAGSSLWPGYLFRQSDPQKTLCGGVSPSPRISVLARIEKVVGKTVFPVASK